jgi:putative ABC transport system permease protein
LPSASPRAVLATFAGMVVLAPVLARPVVKVFGLPLRLRGLSGEIATRNATRNPKRTARTALRATLASMRG